MFVGILQHTSLSPDGKAIAIVGDNLDGMLVDSSTGKVPILLLPSDIYTTNTDIGNWRRLYTKLEDWLLTEENIVNLINHLLGVLKSDSFSFVDYWASKRTLGFLFCFRMASKWLHTCHREPGQDMSSVGC